ncbi:MAG TPA: hypothetical protein VG167_07650 [Verrucomicrobiae bacterium]|nr:hypothetical protein [Verrucomicrobiae bacterium]
MKLARLSVTRIVSPCGAYALVVLSCAGSQLTWTGAVSSDWTNPANWTPQQVPRAGDDAIINSGTVIVPANAAFAVLDWGGGTISGSLTVATGAVLNLTGSATLEGSLTNAGTVVWSAAGGWGISDGGLYNLGGGLIDIQNSATLSISDSTNGYGVFNNAGTVRDSAGGVTVIYALFSNSGLMDVESGTLSLGPGGDIGGQYTTASGSMLEFGGGSYEEVGLPVFSGSGLSMISPGSFLTLTSDMIDGLAFNDCFLILAPTFQGGTITNLTLSGNAALTSTNFVSGVLNLTGVNIMGSVTVLSGAVLNIGSDNYLQGPLTNAGTVVLTGTAPWEIVNDGRTSAGAIYNLAGGLIDIQSDAVLDDFAHSGDVLFSNAGTVRKGGGTGTTSIFAQFNNSGLLDVESGTVALQQGGIVSGQYNTAAGATLDLAFGSFTEIGGAVFSGDGLSEFTAPSLTLNNNLSGNLVLQGGQLFVSPGFQGGSITNLTMSFMELISTNLVSGVFNWQGGSIRGLTVLSTGVLNISGSYDYVQGPLTNAGTVVWSGTGQWIIQNDGNARFTGAVYNQPGGLVDIQDDGSLVGNFGNNFECFNNAGTVRKSYGNVGRTAISVQFNNSGTVEDVIGTIAFNGGYAGTASSTLAFLLEATAGPSRYGQIDFASPLNMTGNLAVSTTAGFVPAPGYVFNLLNYPSATGSFGCLNLDVGGGILMQPSYGPTSLDVIARAYSTTGNRPPLFLSRAPAGLFIAWPQAFSAWELESTTNLTSRSWFPIPVACGNQALIPTVAPQQLFRLRSN